MKGKNLDKGKDSTGVREMDELFRRTDFAAEHTALSERLQEKIQARLSAKHDGLFMGERELFEDELSELAAAGAPKMQNTEALRRILCQTENGRP